MTPCEAAKAAKKRPVPKKGEGEDPDENADQEDEPPKEKKPRAAKSKAKKKTDTDDEEKPAPKRKSKTNDGKKTTRPAAAPESASKPPAEASTDDLWNEKEGSGLKNMMYIYIYCFWVQQVIYIYR